MNASRSPLDPKRWFDRMQPQTLQIATWLLYLNGLFLFIDVTDMSDVLGYYRWRYGALGVLIYAVGEGLLGSPEMFILGNGSSRTVLAWYQDRSGGALPTTAVLSVSIWWYRLLMLFWALWLAFALLSWLKWAWRNFSTGGLSRPWRKAKGVPPTL